MKKSVIFFSTAIALTVLSGSFLSCKQEVETEPEFKVMEGTLAKPEVKVESKFGENVITWSVVDHAREFYIYRAEKAVEAAPTEETPAAQILAKKNKKTNETRNKKRKELNN